jgi:hypothetical protein
MERERELREYIWYQSPCEIYIPPIEMTGKTNNTGAKKASDVASASAPPQNPPAQLTDSKNAVAGGAT